MTIPAFSRSENQRVALELATKCQQNLKNGLAIGVSAAAAGALLNYSPSEILTVGFKAAILGTGAATVKRFGLGSTIGSVLFSSTVPLASMFVCSNMCGSTSATAAALTSAVVGFAQGYTLNKLSVYVAGMMVSSVFAYHAATTTRESWTPLVSVPAGIFIGTAACAANIVTSVFALQVLKMSVRSSLYRA